MNEQERKVAGARREYLGTRVRFTWPGNSRTLAQNLQEEVSEQLETQAGAVRSGKQVFNYKMEALSEIRSCKHDVRAWWQRETVPYLEEGMRLLPKSGLEDFEHKLTTYQGDLAALARKVQDAREDIIGEARMRLGRAFGLQDYPGDLAGLFGVAWSYASLEVPEYLKHLSAEAYASEQARQALRLAGALEMAEQGMAQELQRMVDTLLEKLEAPVPGARKQLKRATLVNLQEFLARFSRVVTWGCDDLEEVVEQAREVLSGVDIESLRRSGNLKQSVGASLTLVSERLSDLLPVAEGETETSAVA